MRLRDREWQPGTETVVYVAPPADGHSRSLLWEMLSGHPGLIVTVGMAFLVAVRLYSVTKGNPVTLHVLIGSRSAADILMGTLAPVVRPLLMSAVFVILGLGLKAGLDGRLTGRWQNAIGVGVAIQLAWYLVLRQEATSPLENAEGDLKVLLIGLLVLALYGLMSAVGRRPKSASRPPPDGRVRAWWAARWTSEGATRALFGIVVVLWSLGAIMALAVVVDDAPWMASERLVTEDGDAVVGYVVEERASELIVMREADRLVQRVPSRGTVRSYCELSVPRERGAPRYAPCSQ
jgi:hypothetical protein